MYNLLKFFIKHHFILLFLVLQIISFYFIVQFNSYQHARFIHTSNRMTGGIYTLKSSITDYFKLRKINEDLAAENAALKSSFNTIHYVEIPSLYNDTIFTNDSVIVDTSYSLQYVPAKVISNSINKQNNVIFVNKGTKDGFYLDMGVVDKKGVIGVVRDASKNYAIIAPIINRTLNVNAKIKGSGYFGNLTWDGKDPLYAQLYDIPNHISPQKGDTIITSGYSKIFDEGHTIGFIESIENIPGKSFIKINVALAVSFGNINFVYGLLNRHENELDSLSLE